MLDLFSRKLVQAHPKKIAVSEMQDMRRTLFQAEQRLLTAQTQVDYYRKMLAFLEDVRASGLESVSDKRRAPAPPAFAHAKRARRRSLC